MSVSTAVKLPDKLKNLFSKLETNEYELKRAKSFELRKIDENKPEQEQNDNKQVEVEEVPEDAEPRKSYLFDSFLSATNEFIGSLDGAVSVLEGIESHQVEVSEQTKSLYENCQKLLQEQVNLDKTVEDFKKPIAYFLELDRISASFGVKMETPLSVELAKKKDEHIGETIMRLKPESAKMAEEMRKLEECIDYMEENRHFYDFAEYHLKFSQLYIRGISLWKKFIVQSIQKSVKGINTVIEITQGSGKSGSELSPPKIHSLYYTRFSALVENVKPVVSELEARVHHSRVPPALLECQKTYYHSRISLLKNLIKNSEQLSNNRKLLDYLRLGGPFLVDLCTKEYELFYDFFDSDVTQAIRSATTDSVSADVDVLDVETVISERSSRSRRSRYSKFTKGGQSVSREFRKKANISSRDLFGQLILGLSGYFYERMRPLLIHTSNLDDLCEAVRIVEGELIESLVEPNIEANYPLLKIFEMVLADIQERLIFCALKFISESILAFKPTKEDLNYPAKLKANETESMYSTWYPTVEKTLLTLSKVFRCVEPVTFSELMDEAISSCMASLLEAGKKIKAETNADLDGDLFLIQHLLILREQITPFHMELKTRKKSLNFSTTSKAFSDLLKERSKLFSLSSSNAFLEMVSKGVPTIEESDLDSKKDLESNLRTVCDRFVLRGFETVLSDILPQMENWKKNLKTAEKLKIWIDEDVSKIPSKMQELAASLALYLSNDQAYSILLEPVKANVFAKLSELHDLVRSDYAENEEFQELDDKLNSLRESVLTIEATVVKQ